MIEIGSGGNYRIAVDPVRNRLYIWYFGELIRATENPLMVQHAQEACQRLKRGFSVLADFSDLTMMGLTDVIAGIQTALHNSGVDRVAAIWRTDSFSKLVVDSQAQKVGDAYADKRKNFFDRSEAEAWLEGQG